MKKTASSDFEKFVTDNLLSIVKQLKEISREQKEQGRDMRKLKRDLGMVTNYFDREYLDHTKRIERLEEFAKLS